MPIPKNNTPLVEGLPLSVVISTFNRSKMLRAALESLGRQSLDKNFFEIVVVDDGSTDETRKTVESFTGTLPIRYFYQNNAGLASARNHGIFAARGKIIFFLDDDDLSGPTLLEEHLKSHKAFPEEYYAVLNYTDWSPKVTVTPLMRFISEEGNLLFSYSNLKDGDILDYTYFWGGRASCKRSFLLKNGVFNYLFRFGNEDTELGYRLSKFGFKVVYNQRALSYMNRSLSFDDFCQRSLKQGRSNYLCSRMHPDPEVQTWCLTQGFNQKWSRIRDQGEILVSYARDLDAMAALQTQYGIPLTERFRNDLYAAYAAAFEACKIQGIMEERKSQTLFSESFPPLTFLLDPVQDLFRVVAIICAYNEGDIIYHVIQHLIENGVYVYLLNHHSTDNTVEEASKWLGKGLLHIELFPDDSPISQKYEQVFALRRITERVEQIHLELGADWYLHYDADEFRESPWPAMALRDAIKLVDVLGYNAIDFELLNFRPTDDSFVPGDDVRKCLHYYEPGEELNKPQIKAWKNFGQVIDLSSFLGHQPLFEGRKVFPSRFVTLHFPVRSSTHGRKKILHERKNRFDEGEKAEGCHVQYDMVSENYNFIRDREELTRYCPRAVRRKLWLDSAFSEGRYSNAPPG